MWHLLALVAVKQLGEMSLQCLQKLSGEHTQLIPFLYLQFLLSQVHSYQGAHIPPGHFCMSSMLLVRCYSAFDYFFLFSKLNFLRYFKFTKM